MENVNFGKQQFVGSVQGSITDSYQMVKVPTSNNIRKLVRVVTVVFTK
jgi:hypothetical protein